MKRHQLGIYGLIVLVFFYFGWYIPLAILIVPAAAKYGKSVSFGKVKRFINRDLRAAKGSVLLAIRTLVRSKRNQSVSDIFEDTVKRYPHKPMFLYGDDSWTFEKIESYANQVAQYFYTVEKFHKGDCVALVASTCPQYVAIWLGLNKIGVITALINCNLKDETLRHAITVAGSKAVIIEAGLFANYSSIMDQLTAIRSTLIFSEDASPANSTLSDFPSFNKNIAKMPVSKPVVRNPAGYYDTLVYIYTSGTTGLPKPCIVTSHRLFTYAAVHHDMLGFSSEDVFYCTLPLYHSAGGAICVGQAIVFGSTIALRKLFSASRFWDDVAKYKCTVFHYVGELCRYLLAQPNNPKEQRHSLRICYGVGLRPQLWSEFVGRFRIPRILECYGSTEGNTAFANLDSKPGAIGFTSRLVEFIKDQYFIKVDNQSGEPIRNEDGFCTKCGPNEPGELVGRITQNKFSGFDGYLQKEATQKKYLANVFQKDDLYFRTGDILMYDEEGYVYFVDRTGDTFRWKGENVSTTEVEGVVSRLVGDVDVAVLGVVIPGCEGRAGMACIGADDSTLNMAEISAGIRDKLPAYARPVFLRFLKHIEVTGTFKIMKSALKEAGYDLDRVGDDHLYYWNSSSGLYERLQKEHYDKITSGKLRM